MKRKMMFSIILIVLLLLAMATTVYACESTGCYDNFENYHVCETKKCFNLYEQAHISEVALLYFLRGYTVRADAGVVDIYLVNPCGYEINVYGKVLTKGQAELVEFFLRLVDHSRGAEEAGILAAMWCCGDQRFLNRRVATVRMFSHEIVVFFDGFDFVDTVICTAWASLYRRDLVQACTGITIIQGFGGYFQGGSWHDSVHCFM